MKPILQPGRNCTGFFQVEESGLLVDARDYYRAFYRTAGAARNYILLAGWQFDSTARLLRGADAEQVDSPIDFLAYLEYLCRNKPQLKIYILAWNYTMLYLSDREWFLEWKFRRAGRGRIHFLYDKFHAIGSCHHQKIAIIDGRVGFAGGIDFSEGRWDDANHCHDNPDRVDSKGNPYEPRHDLQAWFSGHAVRELVNQFLERWAVVAGEKPILPPPPDDIRYEIGPYLAIPASFIAFSRTAARTILPIQESVEEIRSLYRDAITAAASLIYIENQYFSSQAVYQALVDRMRTAALPKLQIVIVLPRKMHAYFEEMSLGLTQMKMTRSLRRVAEETGHALGIYWTVANSAEGTEEQTYIHSKLLLVDDRFLSVGSANTTNRSMGLDSELNTSWEADPGKKDDLFKAIRRVRVTLLAEHAGLRRAAACRPLYRPGGLTCSLDRLTESGRYRLRRYDPDYALGESGWLHELGANELILDPEKPIIEENVFEHLQRYKTGLLTRMILFLNEWFRRKKLKR